MLITNQETAYHSVNGKTIKVSQDAVSTTLHFRLSHGHGKLNTVLFYHKITTSSSNSAVSTARNSDSVSLSEVIYITPRSSSLRKDEQIY